MQHPFPFIIYLFIIIFLPSVDFCLKLWKETGGDFSAKMTFCTKKEEKKTLF